MAYPDSFFGADFIFDVLLPIFFSSLFDCDNVAVASILVLDSKFSFFISSLILYVIFSLSVVAHINDSRLRVSFEEYGNFYTGRNLINPNDDFIIFGASNIGNQDSFSFISTTQNYYGHPYKSSEIVDWYRSIKNINNFFESMPSCEKFSNFIALTNSNRALFSSIDYVPKSITNCSNLIQDNYLGYYVFEISN